MLGYFLDKKAYLFPYRYAINNHEKHKTGFRLYPGEPLLSNRISRKSRLKEKTFQEGR